MDVPAVVLGTNTNALGVIRSLAKGGVPTFVVGDDRSAPAMHSRGVTRVIVPSLDGHRLIPTLLDLAARFGRGAVLFPMTDAQVFTLVQHREQLHDAYCLRVLDSPMTAELLHKQSFHRIAEAHGFPVPRSVSICGIQDLWQLEQLNFPVVIKPSLQRYIAECSAPRTSIVASLREAIDVCIRSLSVVNDWIVQEWVAGADSDIYFCLQYHDPDERRVASFTGRKLRCWPPHRGNTASCMPAPDVAAMLARLTTEFFTAVHFRGLGSMEYKRDGRTGRFVMIEPTVGRTDWQEEVATLNGVNIPLAAYCHAVGLPPPDAHVPSAPVIWRDTLQYWQSVMADVMARRQTAPRVDGRAKGIFWRLEDPLPSLFFLWRWIQRAPRLGTWKGVFAHWFKGGANDTSGVPPPPGVLGKLFVTRVR